MHRRNKTVNVRILKHQVRENIEPYPFDVSRPRTRAECRNGLRPCPFVGCKWNLYCDVNPFTGSIIFNYPSQEPGEIAESCVLDITESGEQTLEEIGTIMNLTRERVRQIEKRCFAKLGDIIDAADFLTDGHITWLHNTDAKEVSGKLRKKKRGAAIQGHRSGGGLSEEDNTIIRYNHFRLSEGEGIREQRRAAER